MSGGERRIYSVAHEVIKIVVSQSSCRGLEDWCRGDGTRETNKETKSNKCK